MLPNIKEVMDYEKKMLVNQLKDRYKNSYGEDIKKRISDLPNYIICDDCEAHHYRYYLERHQTYLNKIKEVFMTVVIDYFLLVGFCFALSSGLFLGLKSIKLI